MRKVFCLWIFLSSFIICFTQINIWNQLPEKYVNLTIDNTESLSVIAKQFVIDQCRYDSLSQSFQVRLWLPKSQFNEFLTQNISYTEPTATQGTSNVMMAYSVEEMENWNRYPTYETYLAMMDSFFHRYPQLCTIDTLLAQTPDHHAILAAHLCNAETSSLSKPSFFYTASIHGDETVGYVTLLHLIDHLLSNYNSNKEIRTILDEIDLWICPLENPDGTYFYSNDTLGDSPISTRGNLKGYDLNRSYPWIGSENTVQLPEVKAMTQFFTQHHITMSAGIHGGAELFNYPWDTWTNAQRSHPDRNWWLYVGCKFASYAQQSSRRGYFNDVSSGAIGGGDWYVVQRSRQDYMNYFRQCRESTIEISETKIPHYKQLPYLWNYLKKSLIDYINECRFGFSGTIIDSYTGLPLQANIIIRDHDDEASFVSSDAQGHYFRPIARGTHKVTFSADGYESQTHTITTQYGQTLKLDVALKPIEQSIPDLQENFEFSIAPNPAHDKIVIVTPIENRTTTCQFFDIQGRCCKSVTLRQQQNELNVEFLSKGFYNIVLTQRGKRQIIKFVKY